MFDLKYFLQSYYDKTYDECKVQKVHGATCNHNCHEKLKVDEIMVQILVHKSLEIPAKNHNNVIGMCTVRFYEQCIDFIPNYDQCLVTNLHYMYILYYICI